MSTLDSFTSYFDYFDLSYGFDYEALMSINVFPGDIVVKYRPRYNGWFKYFVQRAICFFTTEWWMNEHASNVSHAEMVYRQINGDSYTVIDEEPPSVQFKNRGFNRRIIFRQINKPEWFDQMFESYVQSNLGKKYEYTKLLLFVFDWIFHTDWFTKHWDCHHYFVCSEFVAKFYEIEGCPCSGKSFESTAPDDILDFCRIHPELFIIVSDQY